MQTQLLMCAGTNAVNLDAVQVSNIVMWCRQAMARVVEIQPPELEDNWQQSNSNMILEQYSSWTEM